MSFGFSVGDFITAIELANRIRKEFVDAPNQFKAISDEVRSLSIILQDVETVLPERELTKQQQTELHDIAEGCRNVLQNLNETLDKYQELDSNPKTFGRKARRVWKRLKLEPEDIKELRSRMSSNVVLLNAFNSQLTRDNVKLVQHQDDQERRTLLDWLTPTDYGTQQNDYIGRRQEGTGQWLLNSDEFQAWLNKNQQTLFCPGIPGAGKTMIASIVINYLCTKFKNDASIGIAYLFCNYRQQQQQKLEDLILSILKQLAQEQLSMPANVRNLYEYHRNKRTRPSFDEIIKVLHAVIGSYSKVFIIIDALDEYHVSDEGPNELLLEVFSLQTQTQVNLFVTSRFVPEITSQFKGIISKEIRAQDDDVLSYVNGRIPQLLQTRISKYLDLQNVIRRVIVEAVDGMFLLAQLHMDSLSSKSTPEAIRLALQDLPRGTKELDTVYEQAMKRIDGQEEGFRELAKQVLSWVTHAKRPITIAELRHALAVRDGAVELDANFIPEVETLVSICAGLITVDEQSDIIRWIHYTTQKFFERTWILWAPHAQVDIARVCLTYLLFDAFAAGFCSTDGEFEKRLESYPLYDYAARNWGHHVRAASTEVEQLVLDFFKSDAKMSSASQATLASERHHSGGYSQKVPKQTRGVHLAAYFGLREVMIAVLENGYNPNVKDTYCRTPLSWAAENGHKAVVQLLLAQDGIAPDSKDKWGVTPLSWAVTSGHEAVVKLLLATDGVDPGSKDAYGQTPLSRAAEKGHEAVVKLLLEKDGVGPGSKGTYGQTPLSRAAASGHETVVKLLLATDGIDPDSRDKERQTPLSWAAENGHEAVVRLLLEKNDVDPNSKGTYGQTPLFKAAASGHETVVKLLLATDGVKLDSRDKYGQTPLSRAAASGYDAVVKLLLATDGVELGSEDNRGQTPLSLAAANGHEGVVKLLLAKPSVDPEAKNYSGWTPLLWAARNGHEAVVKLLLTKDGVDPNSKDTEYGRTPLSRAAENGHQAVVKLLLATDGVDPDSKDNERQTPLSWAAENGHETVVRLLLAKDGVEIDSKDIEDGQTPFSRAAASGHEMVIKLLLAIDGVDPDSKDRYGQTPLSRAAENGHDAVVELLLAKDGVVSDSKDALFSRTPLLWAAENGHEAVVRLLVEKQSSVNADGPALLETALVGSYTYVLELLLAKYIDWVAQDKFEWLLDLKDASYRVADIISLLFEATSKSPWIAFERPNIDISKGKLNVDVHQPVCAHHVSSTDKREDPLSDPIAFHLKRDVMQGIVASFCGLAGAFPPLKDQPDELEYVKFAGAKASVTFGYENSESEMEDSRDDESSITDLMSFKDSAYFSRSSKLSATSVALSSGPASTKSLDLNKERARSAMNPQLLSRMKLVTQLYQVMQGLNCAASVLQETGFCCDRFTILTMSERGVEPTRQIPRVRINTIPFQYLKILENDLTELAKDGLYGTGLSKSLSTSMEILDILFGVRQSSPISTIDEKLHICALTIQAMCLGLVLYSQGHTGELRPIFLRDPLTEVTLLGSLMNQPFIVVDLRDLACMGFAVGGKVFVLRMSDDFASQIPIDGTERLYLSATPEEIIDTWGPGYLIMDTEAPYGERLYGVEIGGGIINPDQNLITGERQFHWSPDFRAFKPGDETFRYWEKILVGVITVNNTCPLDERRSRELSTSYLSNPGTEPVSWEVHQIQAIFQAGNIGQIQVGPIFQKQPGIPLKDVLLDRWARHKDLSLFDLPWGLQISLCTGVARRVPLRALIEEPLFPFIDRCRIEGWKELKIRAQSAFKEEVDFQQWVDSLNDNDTECMQSIFTHLLDIFKLTGFDRNGEYLSVLWPGNSDPHFCVNVRCNKDQLWCKMLKDSEWCATFAVVTSLCLETPKHKCRKMAEAPWHGGGILLSTAVCPNLAGTIPPTLPMKQWHLKDNEKYWIGKCGGEIWVLVRKLPNSDTELQVRANRFPRAVLPHLWQRQTLRERQAAAFYAEEVFVLYR